MSSREYEEEFDLPENSAVNEERASSAGSPDDLRILEAVLFASDELMTAAHLKTILPGQPDARKIRSMVEKINVQLQKERHPFEVVEIGGGYQFRTITYYHPWVRQIFKEKAAKKLSIQALECLAIIAYKQPISKAEIEMIRGVVSDGAMKTLLEKRLVTIAGRSDKPGRPLLYGTTQTFLKYFGLNRREDLPRIEEFEVMAREKMEGMSLDDLEQEEIDRKVDAVEENAPAGQPPDQPQEPSSLFEVELTGETSDAVDAMSVEDTQPIAPPRHESAHEEGSKQDLPAESSPEADFVQATDSTDVAPVKIEPDGESVTEMAKPDKETPFSFGDMVVPVDEEPEETAAGQDTAGSGEWEMGFDVDNVAEPLGSVEPEPVPRESAAAGRPETSEDSAEAFDLDAAVEPVVEEETFEAVAPAHTEMTDADRIAETPTVKMDAIRHEGTPPSTESDPESERSTVPPAAEVSGDTGTSVSEEEEDAADFELELPTSPEATAENQPDMETGGSVKTGSGAGKEPEELFELETTVASLAEIEKKAPSAPASPADSGTEEEAFEFEASLLPAAEDEQTVVSASKKNREEESVPLPDPDTALFEISMDIVEKESSSAVQPDTDDEAVFDRAPDSTTAEPEPEEKTATQENASEKEKGPEKKGEKTGTASAETGKPDSTAAAKYASKKKRAAKGRKSSK